MIFPNSDFLSKSPPQSLKERGQAWLPSAVPPSFLRLTFHKFSIGTCIYIVFLICISFYFFQVIWHINPSGGDAGEDSIVLQADEVIGGSDSGFGLKYEASALAIEGHT